MSRALRIYVDNEDVFEDSPDHNYNAGGYNSKIVEGVFTRNELIRQLQSLNNLLIYDKSEENIRAISCIAKIITQHTHENPYQDFDSVVEDSDNPSAKYLICDTIASDYDNGYPIEQYSYLKREEYIHAVTQEIYNLRKWIQEQEKEFDEKYTVTIKYN